MSDAKINELIPDPNNANKGTQRGLKALDTSLRKYKIGRGVLTDKHGVLIAGNKTVERIADIAPDTKVVVVETDGNTLVVTKRMDLDLETDPEARALATYDNRVGQLDLDWDLDALGALDADVLGDLWSDKELADLGVNLGEPPEDPGAQIDKADELRQKWGVELGQLWKLGEHRLICGDCTDRAVVDRVMMGDIAMMVWTDPPYGVSYGDKLEAANPMGYRVRNIENDSLPAGELEILIRSAFQNCAEHSIPGAAIYAACPAGTPLPTAIAAFVGSGFEFRWQLVWVKDQIVLSRADYHFQHENILYGWKPDAGHHWEGDRKQSSCFFIDRPKKSEEHPTMKPVELVEKMLVNNSNIGSVVLEPFSGSGTTLIACERLGRKCRAVEISPGYVAVAIQRWVDMTGGEPELISNT